jgi:hypothetical protein
MDWEQGRWDAKPRAVPPEPTYPEAFAWRVVKDTRWAEGRVRTLPHGREVRFVTGGKGRDEVLGYSLLCRDEQELVAHLNGTRQNFERVGWTLVADSPPQ